MKNKCGFFNVLFSIFMIALIFFIGFNGSRNYNVPEELFQVYLNGEVIGVIESKDELLKMIDDEQAAIKEKYGVDQVYLPKNLEIKSVVTYSGKIDNVKNVYDSIKKTENFTIKGYEVTINEDDETTKKIYLLNKTDLDDSVKNVVLAFMDEDEYNSYLNNTQEAITDVGEYIENISIVQDVTIKPAYISTEEEIFTNSTDLTRYLLFGTMDTQKEYKIKSGDTISEVADKNKLSVEEFLIANPELKSEDVLLYPGQVVNIALINPVLDISVLSEKVAVQNVAYSTKYEYDYSIAANTYVVKQEGIKGKSKITFKVETVNGQDKSVVKTNTVVISSPVTKIVLRGSGGGGSYINTGEDWGWPTVSGCYFTSAYGWRWGEFHYGLDITGTGYGSPIFAAGDGTVIGVGYGSSTGTYVSISHGNGIVTKYFHLKRYLVSIGDTITKGQKIAEMGYSGHVIPAGISGTHLHFQLEINGTTTNPLSLYDTQYCTWR